MFRLKIIREPKQNTPYRVGLALSGGGARGVAHAGALQAMLEVGLKPDIVAGVSAGSIVAAMYSAGIAPCDMVSFFSNAKFSDFARLGAPTDGLFSMQRFCDFLSKTLRYERIEQLPVKTVICATNFDTGQKVAFEEGSLARCVCASCCIPIVFKPIHMDGQRYVDGGVLDNMPAWAIRQRVRFLAGVNVSPVPSHPGRNNLVDIALRSFELMSKHNAQADNRMCDMLIRTDDIADYKVFDLRDLDRVFDSGYRDTMRFFASKGIVPGALQQ